MTPEAQQIAMAEAHGWDYDPEEAHEWGSRGQWVRQPEKKHERRRLFSKNYIPDYLNDYTAIRDVLDTLGISNGNNPELRIAWMTELHKIVDRHRPKNKVGTPIVYDIDKMFAERKELVEATLRVIGKWEGGAKCSREAAATQLTKGNQ